MERDIEDDICWANAPPPPLPGMCYIEPHIKHDFTSFDGSLDGVIPKRLYTDLVEALDIDFMGIVLGYDEESDWLETSDVAVNQGKRGEILNREKIKKSVSELFDYQKYIQDSFDDVDDIVHPTDRSIKVEAAFEVIPDTTSENTIVQSECTEINSGISFEMKDGVSKLFNTVDMSDGSTLTCLSQRVNDLILFHVRDGNAYYSDVSTLHKLQKHRKQNVDKNVVEEK